MSSRDMSLLEAQTKKVYDANAVAFDQQRSKDLFEQKWLDRFRSHLQHGDAILDCGCGSGEPIAGYFIRNKYAVTGVDFSPEMLKIARHRFPQNDWLLQDMRQLKIARTFEGVISWNAFFHLNHQDQCAVFSKLNDHLKLGGVLMLTVGHMKGEVVGQVNGQSVYHSSLSLDEYKSILIKYRFQLLDFIPQDPDCRQHTVLLAKKVSSLGP